MSANNAEFVPNLTFVSTTGPTLDNVSTKAMRAHTTRVNFARRRRRLVREYGDQKKAASRGSSLQHEEDVRIAGREPSFEIQRPIYRHTSFDRDLNRTEAFYINFLLDAMGKLHLVANIPASDTAFAMMESDWARFLPDPTMFDVSLYFARLVYASRRQQHAVQFIEDAYKGKALRSVRQRLSIGSSGLSDSLISSILLLTCLDQGLGNIEAWKIHIAGLFQIIKVRFRDSNELPTHLISNAFPRTILEGLLRFSRHDEALLATFENMGIFDSMFSVPAKKATYLIMANAEQVAALQDMYVQDKQLLVSERLWIKSIVESLDTAIQLNNSSSNREEFITAIALSLKIFLGVVLRSTKITEDGLGDMAPQMMEVLQQPDQQLPTSMSLCSSLKLTFWQTMMGAIACPDAEMRSFFTSRLERMSVALGLTSWQDAERVLENFFWIPSIFSALGSETISEVLDSQHRVPL